MIPFKPWKYKSDKDFLRDQDLALRNLFKKEIKPNFLIKIYHKVIDEIGDNLSNYYSECNEALTVENTIASDNISPVFDICKMIIGIDKSNMIFINENEQRKRLSDVSYENKLVSEVVANVKLRSYGSSYFRQKQIMYGDRFLYFGLPYDLFVICFRINELLCEDNSNIANYPIFNKISSMGLASLSLLEDNFLNNIYPICRGIIELYIIYSVIKDNKNATKKYNYFSKIEIEQSQCGQSFPQDFLDMFEKRLYKESENEPIHPFLHFGWVDELKDYHKIVKRKPYTINGLVKYLNTKDKDKDNTFNVYYDYYQKCHSFTHATTYSFAYPLLSYFEICIMLYITIVPLYIEICEKLKVDKKINDVDIELKSQNNFNLLLNQYKNRTTENFEKYYKKSAN